MASVVTLMLLFQLVRWYERSETSHEKPDLVTGPQGAFPAVLGTAAPVAPDHVIRSTTDHEALAHGLLIRSTDTGVKTVNLRTGKQYWRYERGDKDLAAAWFEASERTVVIWFPDGRLTGIDLRTGKPLWHRRIPQGRSLRPVSVHIVGNQVVTEVPGGVRAFSERGGRTLWTAEVRGSCDETPVVTAYEFPDHLSVVLVSCDRLGKKKRVGSIEFTPGVEKSSDVLLGIDNRTGDVLWQRRSGADAVFKGDEHTLVALNPNRLVPRVDLLDVNRAGVSQRTDVSVKETWPVVAGNGVVVSNLDPEIYAFDSNTLLSVHDTEDGHLLWKLRSPSRQAYGIPAIADGRVYVVRQTDFRYRNADKLTDADLLVLDADTGRLLHTLRLPELRTPKKVNSRTTLDVHVADGAVGIAWRSDRTDLLVVTD